MSDQNAVAELYRAREEIARLREGMKILRASDANVMRERVYALETQLAEMRSRAVTAETDRDLALAEIAVMRGTLARHSAPDDQPIIVHDCPPDAPR